MTTGSRILARTITTAANLESNTSSIIEAAADPESLTADTLAGVFAGIIGFGTSGLVASLLKPAQTTLQSALSTVAPSIAGGFTGGSAYSIVDQYVKEGEVDPAEVLKTGALSALFAGAFSFLGAIGTSMKSLPKNPKGASGQGKGSGRVEGEGVEVPGTGIVDESLAALKSPSSRHYADKVTQKSVSKEINTVVDRSVVSVPDDVRAIRAGQAQKIGDNYLIDGRIYGSHDGTLYPISGPGMYQLDRGAYKALGVLNKFGDTEQANTILRNMGVSAETKAQALEVWRVINK